MYKRQQQGETGPAGADGIGDTYTGADFALSNQACDAGDLMWGIDVDGTIQCTPELVYSAGYGLLESSEEFRVDTSHVVVRQRGGLHGLGTSTTGSFASGSAGMHSVITVDVGVRGGGEPVFNFRCIRTNSVVTSCLNVVTGATSSHITFSPGEQTMFDEGQFRLVSVQNGRGAASLRVDNTHLSSTSVSFEGVHVP